MAGGFFIFNRVSTANSSLKARIHQSTFSFFGDIGKQLIDQEGQNLKVPDFETKFKHGSARVYQLSISEFEAPNFDLKLAEDGMRWHASGGRVNFAGKFRVRYRFLGIKMRKTGNIRGTASDLNLDLSAKIVNVNGKQQIMIGSCTANLNHIKISFHGSGIVNWLINKFHKKVEKRVQKEIRKQASELAQRALEKEVNQKIMEMPTHIPLREGFAVDYSLEEDPIFTQDFMDSNINAFILYENTTCEQKRRRGDWNVFHVSGYLHPKIKDNQLTGSISNLTMSAMEEFSTIGHVPPEYFCLLTGKVFTKIIQDAGNVEFQLRLPLPIIHFKQFTIGTDSEVDVLDGAVRLNLDFAKLN